MAIVEHLRARAHGGTVSAHLRIDDSTDPPKLVGFRLVVPAGKKIDGFLLDTPWEFTSEAVAALPGGIYDLAEPIDGVWREADPEDPDDESGWIWPRIAWRVRVE